MATLVAGHTPLGAFAQTETAAMDVLGVIRKDEMQEMAVYEGLFFKRLRPIYNKIMRKFQGTHSSVGAILSTPQHNHLNYLISASHNYAGNFSWYDDVAKPLNLMNNKMMECVGNGRVGVMSLFVRSSFSVAKNNISDVSEALSSQEKLLEFYIQSEADWDYFKELTEKENRVDGEVDVDEDGSDDERCVVM